MNAKRIQLPNINFITCSKAHDPKNLHLHFTELLKCDNVNKLCLTPSINKLACSKAEKLSLCSRITQA